MIERTQRDLLIILGVFDITLMFILLTVFICGQKYYIYRPVDVKYSIIDTAQSGDGKVLVKSAKLSQGHFLVELEGQRPGLLKLPVTLRSTESTDSVKYTYVIYVTKSGVLFGPNMDFNGRQIVSLIISILLFIITLLFFWVNAFSYVVTR